MHKHIAPTCASATGDSTLPSLLVVAMETVTGVGVRGGVLGGSALDCGGGLVEMVVTFSLGMDVGDGDGSFEVLGDVVAISGAGQSITSNSLTLKHGSF